MTSGHEKYMAMALREAQKAAEDGEVPAGCVIIDAKSQAILARSHNQCEQLRDATAHAEILALTSASAARGAWRLEDTILYVTKEPCPMCAGAIALSRIPLVVWGVSDPKRGGETVFGIFSHPGMNHHPQIVKGVLEAESKEVIQSFFKRRRDNAKTKKQEKSDDE